MDQNQNPAPAPQANIPPPFTLPPSVTSVPSVSASSQSSQIPTQNPEMGSKKKWVKIGVIAILAISIVGVLLYFGKDYLFKGQLEEIKIAEEEGVITPEEGVKAPEEEGALAPDEGKILEGVDSVCSDADYAWGPWSECSDGKQVRSGSNASCDPGLTFQSQVCSVEGEFAEGAGEGTKIALGEDMVDGEGIAGSSEESGSGTIAGDDSPAGTGERSSDGGLIAGDASPAGTDGSGGGSESGAITGAEISGGGQTAGEPAPTSSGGPQGIGYGGASTSAGTGGQTPRLIVNGAQTQVSQETQAVRGTQQNASQSGVVEGRLTAPGVAQAGSAGLHGAYIQGQTGPGLFLYPFMLAGANALYFWRKKRKATKR